MSTARLARIADQIQRELAELIRQELRDPRVKLVTITGVDLARDQSHAKVYFTTLGSPEDAQACGEGLSRAAGFLRAGLAHRLSTRTVPDLHFAYDDSVERGVRLSRLIDEAVTAPAGEPPVSELPLPAVVPPPVAPRRRRPPAEAAEVAAGPDGVLLVDKPAGITSTRALAMAKRALGSQKAGHTGTLDPFATGLLPLVFGEATKFARFLIESDKTYLATLQLGATSSTGDPEGEIAAGTPVNSSSEEIEALSRELLGISTQIPPMHSAIRIDGRRLYDLARQGVEVVREPRIIRVEFLEILKFSGEKLVISVKCSKGTYIRTLAETIGERLGCGAYLTDLRRTAAAGFVVEDSATPEALAAMGTQAARSRLLPVEILVASLPRVDLLEGEAWAIRNGQELAADPRWPVGEQSVFGPSGEFIGVARVMAGGRLAAERLMATDAAG